MESRGLKRCRPLEEITRCLRHLRPSSRGDNEVQTVSIKPANAGTKVGAELLIEFQKAHANLLNAMTDLDGVTNEPLPQRERIINSRWRISRASLARRSLWNEIYAYLSYDSSEANHAELRRLQESDRALLRSSSEHVSEWKIDAVVKEWPSYCAASNAIRWKMKAAIGMERRLLYPMLRTDAT